MSIASWQNARSAPRSQENIEIRVTRGVIRQARASKANGGVKHQRINERKSKAKSEQNQDNNMVVAFCV